MEPGRRSATVYVTLIALWGLVVAWQIEEHWRVETYAKTALRNRSRDIANTLGASIRGLQFRGAVFGDRLQPVLNEAVGGSTNEAIGSAEVKALVLLNALGEPVASAGRSIDLQQNDILQEGERWGRNTVTFVYPIEGASVTQEGLTNASAPVVLPALTNNFRDAGRGPPRRERFESETNRLTTATNQPGNSLTSNVAGSNGVARSERSRSSGPPDGRPRRPFWARGLDDKEYQALIQKRELHGLVVAMSTGAFDATLRHDLELRFIVAFFASVAALGCALAWRNITKSSNLQLRLVRASELTAHLREMNLAAAGLAHETRNPLNIIRGLAHMISKQPDNSAEIRSKTREIIDEADKVAAQLNEFINYSRPREVHPKPVLVQSLAREIARALNYDMAEKQITLDCLGDELTVLADEQLLRQALFNLILNAVQAVEPGGKIEVLLRKTSATDGSLEIRDNGPGVAPAHRSEIFKPYFTAQKTGTGLGLAVVQQIVLAHGWEIRCVPNEPKGASFQISHFKLA